MSVSVFNLNFIFILFDHSYDNLKADIHFQIKSSSLTTNTKNFKVYLIYSKSLDY